MCISVHTIVLSRSLRAKTSFLTEPSRRPLNEAFSSSNSRMLTGERLLSRYRPYAAERRWVQ